VKPGRNEPCPCRSGLKVKRCCGVEGAHRRDEAAAELLSLALHFPRYRPASAAFDEWARAAPSEPSHEAVEQGIAAMGADERERILAGFRDEYPEVWNGVVNDFGDEERANQLVLIGAVVTGVNERFRSPDPVGLEIVELGANTRADPVEALALTLDPSDLWSVIESWLAVEAFHAGSSIAAVADRLATGWHDERLEVLVERLRGVLPDPGYPLASGALEDACRAFAEDKGVRRRLRTELLLDALPTVLDAMRAAA
jgi:SEC-C motif